LFFSSAQVKEAIFGLISGYIADLGLIIFVLFDIQ
jgi:hypothetical protein